MTKIKNDFDKKNRRHENDKNNFVIKIALIIIIIIVILLKIRFRKVGYLFLLKLWLIWSMSIFAHNISEFTWKLNLNLNLQNIAVRGNCLRYRWELLH